jgi:hypothetical protein
MDEYSGKLNDLMRIVHTQVSVPLLLQASCLKIHHNQVVETTKHLIR